MAFGPPSSCGSEASFVRPRRLNSSREISNVTNLRAAILGAVLFTGVGCSGTATEAPQSLRIFSTQPGQTLSGPSAGASVQVLADFLGRSATGLTVEQSTVAADGVTHLRVSQQLGGLRVVGAYARAAVRPSGELVHVIDTLVADQPVPAARLAAADALQLTLAHHGYGAAPLAQRSVLGNVITFEPSLELFSEPTVEHVAYLDSAGALRSGFEVQTWSLVKNVLHHTLVSDDGQVVNVELRTNNDSYNVFTEDPAKGPQTVVAGPGAGNAQSPSGWLTSATQLDINITGNNANAYLDADGNNRADRGGVAVGGGNFVSAIDLNQAPTTTSNRAGAVQNLFYFNNVVHDTLYRHGFNEAAGNFQVNNFGKGGAGNDPVQAEAQDGSGTDNANFSTPADGQKPRMQMYLWSGTGPTHEVLTGGQNLPAKGAAFGPAMSTTGSSGPLAFVNDGVGVGNDGCEASAAGSLTGKIAVVVRGSCNFTVKVLNAQNAGATAVIVINNVPGSEYFGMSGTERRVKISSVMVSQLSSAALVAGASATARSKVQQPLMIDGDIDSDIVFHEYGHGLTWRMVGGMSGKLAGAIGEGASDTVAFLIDGDDKVGEYAYGNVNGIRRYPYAGYPLTYGNVTGAEVHDDGEIFGAAMYRVHQQFAAAGLSDDVVLDVFVDGLNYVPATPSYEQMRDGLLQSIAVRNQPYACYVWKAFAQTGIGVGASGVVTSTGVSITESFAVPASCP